MLDRPIVGAKIAPVRLKTPVATGDVVTVVGFGQIESGERAPVRMKRAGLDVKAVGPWASDTGYGLAVSEFFVTESICGGDSGGPALGASGAVLGVVSRSHNGGGKTECEGGISVFTELPGMAKVAEEAFAAAKATAWLEGEPQPVPPEDVPADDAGAADGGPAGLVTEPVQHGCSVGLGGLATGAASRSEWFVAFAAVGAVLVRRRLAAHHAARAASRRRQPA